MTLEEIKEEALRLFKTARKVWEEDDCTRHTDGHKTVSIAFAELIQNPHPVRLLTVDNGDQFIHFHVDGWISTVSYDVDAIYKLETT